MKRLIVTLLMITISLSLFTGCGSKDTSKSGDNDTAVDVKPEPTINKGEAIDKDKKDDKATNTEKVQAGTELSTFMSNYIDAKTKVWDEMSKDMEKNDNTAFSMSTLGFVFMDLIIVEIGLFDALNTKEGDTFKGALMLSGIDAWKKVKSDVIEFGYDYVHKDDKNQNKKGDREVTTGKFDKTNNSVIYKKYTERNGEKTSMYIVEITSNSNKSYSSQVYFLEDSEDDSKSNKTLNCYFTWVEMNNISCIFGEKDNIDFNFTYESIFNKKNVKPEDMAKGINIKFKSSYVDGKSKFEEMNN